MGLLDYWKILRPNDCFLAVIAVLAGLILTVGDSFIFWSALKLGYFVETIAFACVSVFVICGAGIVLNDFFDAKIDRINAPHRPIPSGKIKKNHALYYSIILFVIGLILAWQINIYIFALALINTFLEILYAWKFKKMFLVGNIVDSWFPASSFIFGALIVGFYITDLSSYFSQVFIWLALLAFLANLGREIFGDLEDVEGDLKSNARTMPIVLGDTKAVFFARVFIVLAVLLSFVPFSLQMLGFNYLILVFIADIMFVYSLTLQPGQNQAVTKWAMLVAMLAFIVGVL